MKKFICLLLIIAIAAGCKKSSSTVSTVDFTPLTVGSTWTYITSDGTTSTSSTFAVTNKDTLINSSTYKVISNTAGSNIYFGKKNSDYYRVGLLPNIQATGVFEDLYIKDNLTLNATWALNSSITYAGTPYNVTYTYKATQLGITKVIAGKTYTDVTDIQLVASAVITGTTLSFGGGDFYYARGIGLISSNISITIPFQAPITQQINLQSYTIK